MSLDLRNYSARLVGLLLIVEAVSVYFLWTLNATAEDAQGAFALLIAIDLVAFAMISYIYRAYKSGNQFNRGLVIAGCAMIVILVYANLTL